MLITTLTKFQDQTPNAPTYPTTLTTPTSPTTPSTPTSQSSPTALTTSTAPTSPATPNTPDEIYNTILITGGYYGVNLKTSEAITANSTCLTVADLQSPNIGNALITVEGPNGKAVRCNCDIFF